MTAERFLFCKNEALIFFATFILNSKYLPLLLFLTQTLSLHRYWHWSLNIKNLRKQYEKCFQILSAHCSVPLMQVTIFSNWDLDLEEKGKTILVWTIKHNFASVLGSVTCSLVSIMLKVNYMTYFSMSHMIHLYGLISINQSSRGHVCSFFCSVT